MSSTIINNIPGIEHYSYLELGVFRNKNFDAIKCYSKFSVDINGRAMYTGTTDDYFAQLDAAAQFDIVFIDANHDYDYVIKDFNNAVDQAVRWIAIHDMIPPSVKHTQSKFCSDSFRVLYFLLKETNFEIYPMNTNFGLTFVRMPAAKISPGADYANVSYGEFMEFISHAKLYSDQEIIEILKDSNV